MAEAKLGKTQLRLQRQHLGDVLLAHYEAEIPAISEIGTLRFKQLHQETVQRLRDKQSSDVADVLEKFSIDEFAQEVKKKLKTLRERKKRQAQSSSQGTLRMLSRRVSA